MYTTRNLQVSQSKLLFFKSKARLNVQKPQTVMVAKWMDRWMKEKKDEQTNSQMWMAFGKTNEGNDGQSV